MKDKEKLLIFNIIEVIQGYGLNYTFHQKKKNIIKIEFDFDNYLKIDLNNFTKRKFKRKIYLPFDFVKETDEIIEKYFIEMERKK